MAVAAAAAGCCAIKEFPCSKAAAAAVFAQSDAILSFNFVLYNRLYNRLYNVPIVVVTTCYHSAYRTHFSCPWLLSCCPAVC
jgi:hypothetical protein